MFVYDFKYVHSRAKIDIQIYHSCFIKPSMINAYIFIYSTLCSIVVVRDFFFLSGRPYSFKTNDILSFSHNVHIDESHLDNVLSTLLYTSKSSMRRYFMVEIKIITKSSHILSS